jgi:hypothetical protein
MSIYLTKTAKPGEYLYDTQQNPENLSMIKRPFNDLHIVETPYLAMLFSVQIEYGLLLRNNQSKIIRTIAQVK